VRAEPGSIILITREVRKMAKWRLDPVCKTKVDKEKAKYRNKIEGEDVYFCSIECKQEFDQ